MKIGDMQKLIEEGSGENDDSNIRFYCETEELFDVFKTAHVNKEHEVQDIVLFVIRKIFLFISSFLSFCLFLSVMEAKLRKKYCSVTR